MDNTKRYTRWYCSHCKDFTLHNPKTEDCDGECTICDTITPRYHFKDVPIEKLELQRERYKLQEQKKSSDKLQSMMLMVGGFGSLFDTPFGNDNVKLKSCDEIGMEINETDAGQENIWKREKIAREKLREEKIAHQLKFSAMMPNDICLCGSGKKFKKCCKNKLR